MLGSIILSPVGNIRDLYEDSPFQYVTRTSVSLPWCSSGLLDSCTLCYDRILVEQEAGSGEKLETWHMQSKDF